VERKKAKRSLGFFFLLHETNLTVISIRQQMMEKAVFVCYSLKM
jgi:hypothetical protein